MDALFEDPLALRFLDGLADLGRLVMFDRRGIGLSDPPRDSDVSGLTFWVEDLTTIMEAAEVAHPILVGRELGADAALFFALGIPTWFGVGVVRAEPWRARRPRHLAPPD